MKSNSHNRTTKALVAVVVFITTFLLVRTLYFPHTSEGQREARVHAASEHAKTVVEPLLAKEKRFEEVNVYGWWKDEGYFRVRGGVETEGDLKDLKRLIMATRPPAPVAWDVVVNERQPADTNVTNILSAEQAATLAQRLANEKAQTLYNCQPFSSGSAARLVDRHWVWRERQAHGSGDIEASVEFAADGTKPSVSVSLLDSRPQFPASERR